MLRVGSYVRLRSYVTHVYAHVAAFWLPLRSAVILVYLWFAHVRWFGLPVYRLVARLPVYTRTVAVYTYGYGCGCYVAFAVTTHTLQRYHTLQFGSAVCSGYCGSRVYAWLLFAAPFVLHGCTGSTRLRVRFLPVPLYRSATARLVYRFLPSFYMILVRLRYTAACFTRILVLPAVDFTYRIWFTAVNTILPRLRFVAARFYVYRLPHGYTRLPFTLFYAVTGYCCWLHTALLRTHTHVLRWFTVTPFAFCRTCHVCGYPFGWLRLVGLVATLPYYAAPPAVTHVCTLLACGLRFTVCVARFVYCGCILRYCGLVRIYRLPRIPVHMVHARSAFYRCTTYTVLVRADYRLPTRLVLRLLLVRGYTARGYAVPGYILYTLYAALLPQFYRCSWLPVIHAVLRLCYRARTAHTVTHAPSYHTPFVRLRVARAVAGYAHALGSRSAYVWLRALRFLLYAAVYCVTFWFFTLLWLPCLRLQFPAHLGLHTHTFYTPPYLLPFCILHLVHITLPYGSTYLHWLPHVCWIQFCSSDSTPHLPRVLWFGLRYRYHTHLLPVCLDYPVPITFTHFGLHTAFTVHTPFCHGSCYTVLFWLWFFLFLRLRLYVCLRFYSFTPRLRLPHTFLRYALRLRFCICVATVRLQHWFTRTRLLRTCLVWILDFATFPFATTAVGCGFATTYATRGLPAYRLRLPCRSTFTVPLPLHTFWLHTGFCYAVGSRGYRSLRLHGYLPRTRLLYTRGYYRLPAHTGSRFCYIRLYLWVIFYHTCRCGWLQVRCICASPVAVTWFGSAIAVGFYARSATLPVHVLWITGYVVPLYGAQFWVTHYGWFPCGYTAAHRFTCVAITARSRLRYVACVYTRCYARVTFVRFCRSGYRTVTHILVTPHGCVYRFRSWFGYRLLHGWLLVTPTVHHAHAGLCRLPLRTTYRVYHAVGCRAFGCRRILYTFVFCIAWLRLPHYGYFTPVTFVVRWRTTIFTLRHIAHYTALRLRLRRTRLV